MHPKQNVAPQAPVEVGLAGKAASSQPTDVAPARSAATPEKRSFIEQKAALNLAQMAGSSVDPTLTGNGVESLVNALIVRIHPSRSSL